MLPGEQRRRYEHRHLLAVPRRLHRRAHSDLRLAIPHIPEQKPVHHAGRFHIFFDFLDTLPLSIRFLIFKGVFELLLPHRILRESMSLAFKPLGIQIHKVKGQF
ncbi:MAG: hypothetical protein DELT_03027 [Desulfovibrio sp.]